MKHRIKFNNETELLGFENKENLIITREIIFKKDILEKLEKIARHAKDSKIKISGYKKDGDKLKSKSFLWYSGDEFDICLEDKGIYDIETYVVFELGGTEYSRPINDIKQITDEYIEFEDEKIEYQFRY